MPNEKLEKKETDTLRVWCIFCASDGVKSDDFCSFFLSDPA